MDSNPNRFILSKLPRNERIRFHDKKKNVSMNGIWFWMSVLLLVHNINLFLLWSREYGGTFYSLAKTPKMCQLIVIDFSIFDRLCINLNYSMFAMQKQFEWLEPFDVSFEFRRTEINWWTCTVCAFDFHTFKNDRNDFVVWMFQSFVFVL